MIAVFLRLVLLTGYCTDFRCAFSYSSLAGSEFTTEIEADSQTRDINRKGSLMGSVRVILVATAESDIKVAQNVGDIAYWLYEKGNFTS